MEHSSYGDKIFSDSSHFCVTCFKLFNILNKSDNKVNSNNKNDSNISNIQVVSNSSKPGSYHLLQTCVKTPVEE